MENGAYACSAWRMQTARGLRSAERCACECPQAGCAFFRHICTSNMGITLCSIPCWQLSAFHFHFSAKNDIVHSILKKARLINLLNIPMRVLYSSNELL